MAMTEEQKEVRDNFIKTVREFKIKGKKLKQAYVKTFPNHTVKKDRDHLIFTEEHANMAVFNDGKVVIL